MKEHLLQLIWQFGIFNKQQLYTTQGESLQIQYSGTHNLAQGPDFLNARIVIGNACWVGNVEIHVMASSWIRHGHSGDPHYQNVILHVVWEEDERLQLPIPVLELKGRVSALMLSRFRQMMSTDQRLACSAHFSSPPHVNLQSWRDRLAVERLEQRKEALMREFFDEGISWHEILWRQMLTSFGMPRNQEVFRGLAVSTPFALVCRLREDPFQLEALLMGQLGMLSNPAEDEYSFRLKKEYDFLAAKFNLLRQIIPLHWFGCRPASSPAVRLSQLANFIQLRPNIINWVLGINSLSEVKKSLDISASVYWETHVAPGVPALRVPARAGQQFQYHVIINAVIPFLFCYADYHGDNDMKERAIDWLAELPAEKNGITNLFIKMGMKNRSSVDSQGIIQLYKHYCRQKRCLQCVIGLSILKK